jgi:hypothetical protein
LIVLHTPFHPYEETRERQRLKIAIASSLLLLSPLS